VPSPLQKPVSIAAREQEVSELICAGLRNQEISDRLIFRKLEVEGRISLVIDAVKKRLVTVHDRSPLGAAVEAKRAMTQKSPLTGETAENASRPRWSFAGSLYNGNTHSDIEQNYTPAPVQLPAKIQEPCGKTHHRSVLPRLCPV
jgi:DNA-binding CsgD family transcriptional regulator